MERRQDNSDDALATMKRRQEDGRKVSKDMKRRHEDESEGSTKMERRNEDGNDNLDESTDSREYRTAKRRKGVSKQDPESSPSTSSDDSAPDESDSSSWYSSDTDNESLTELPGEKPLENDVALGTEKVLEEIKKEEDIVLGDLDHFWSSQVAPKARKDLGKLKTRLDKNMSSLEIVKTRCGNVEKLMQLPCVLSVGFKKEHSKFTVTVSDRNKALELSEELTNPNIDLVEARHSHLL